MALYKVRNLQAVGDIFLPISPSVRIVPGQTVTVSVPASRMDDPSISVLVNSGAIDVSSAADPATPDGIETATVSQSFEGNASFVDPSSPVVLHVRTDGSDTNDGLSANNAYRTIQYALEQIPRNSVGTFDVQMGPGTFTAPVIRDGWPGATIRVWADRSTPILTLAPNTDMVNVAGTYHSHQLIGAGAHSGIPDDNSHWIEADTVAGSPHPGYSAQASPSPDLVAVSEVSTITDIIAIHPRTTVFESPSTSSGTWGVLSDSKGNQPEFIGIDFDFSNQVDSSFPVQTPRFVDLRGCRIRQYLTDPAATVTSAVMNEGVFSGISNAADYQSVAGIVQQFGVSLRGGSGAARVLVKGPNIGTFNRIDVENVQASFFGFIDFDASAASTLPAISIQQSSNISFGASPNFAVGSSYGGSILVEDSSSAALPSSPMTGSVAGLPVDVKDGSRVTGLGAGHTITNSVTPGDDVVIGANAATTFALAAGTNDFAAANSQGCLGGA